MRRLDDWRPAPNIGRHPEIYERENEAIARDGRLESALLEIADPAGKHLLDIGCGTGFWLPRWSTARRVTGVEPDPDLLERAQLRMADAPSVDVRHGSAEHLPLDDDSVDIAQARFAYFFGPGAESGLAEVHRVLAPGGVFIAVDNAWGQGDFAELLRGSSLGNAAIDPARTDAWWAARGASRVEVLAGWQATSPDELEEVLRIEFPGPVVDRWVADHPGQAALTYAYALYVWRPPE